MASAADGWSSRRLNGKPTLPTANAVSPAVRSAWVRNSVRVVFPFVPVIAMSWPDQNSDAKSSSPRQVPPATRAVCSQAWSGANPGLCLLYTSDTADEEDSVDLGG